MTSGTLPVPLTLHQLSRQKFLHVGGSGALMLLAAQLIVERLGFALQAHGARTALALPPPALTAALALSPTPQHPALAIGSGAFDEILVRHRGTIELPAH